MMIFLCMQQGRVKLGSCRNSMGKRRRPRPINRHASIKVTGYWGTRHSARATWLCPEAKSERALGMGATVGVLGTRVLGVACLGPRAWLHSRPSMARLHQQTLKTLARGQASRGGRRKASSGAASPSWLARAERSRRGAPHEVYVTQAMTTGARQAPARAVSSFPLWC